MLRKKNVDVIVAGGQATAGPPLGPALGPLGVNVLQIVNQINEVTKSYAGMKVPVKVSVDIETKKFDVLVGIPTTAALIVKEAGIKKGSGTPNIDKVGNISIGQILDIAKIKQSSLLSRDIKSASKEIIGTCVSMGVTVGEKDPKIVLQEITDGKHDTFFV